MSWHKTFLLLFAAAPAMAADGWLIGAGVEADTDDGLRGALIAGVGLSEKTWLSGGASHSSVDFATGRSSSTTYADIELDHHFDPVGISVGAAYWGDPDVLDSVDLRAALYWKNDAVMLAVDAETRDFDFIIPPSDFFVGREFAFDADGIGGRLRFSIGDRASLRFSAMRYDYSVDFRPDENRDAISLITVSRLSPLTNLIDSRAGIDLGVDVGVSSRWELDFTTWKGALDRSRTDSYTLRFLTPLGRRTDIELGLGFDESDLYGDVTYFSVYLYFYGD